VVDNLEAFHKYAPSSDKPAKILGNECCRWYGTIPQNMQRPKSFLYSVCFLFDIVLFMSRVCISWTAGSKERHDFLSYKLHEPYPSVQLYSQAFLPSDSSVHLEIGFQERVPKCIAQFPLCNHQPLLLFLKSPTSKFCSSSDFIT